MSRPAVPAVSSPTAAARRLQDATHRIGLLASLEVTGPHLAPLLLQELRDVLPFDTGGYFHKAPDGTLASFMEAPPVQDTVSLYLDARMQAQERRLARPYDEAARVEFGPQLRHQLIKVPWAEFARSDFYNLLLRPHGLDDCVSLMPRQADGRPVGALKLYRQDAHRLFRAEDTAALARLEPLIAAALAPRGNDAGEDTQAQGTELLVASEDGRLLWRSATSEAWTALAFPGWTRRAVLPDALCALLQRLRWLREGRPAVATSSAPAELVLRNASGCFRFRACGLDPAGDGPQAVGLQVTRELSRSLQLLLALRRLGLPPRQVEVGYWLTRGLTEAQIARRLGITQHTAVYHRRQLYARLAVSQRAEFIARLLAAA